MVRKKTPPRRLRSLRTLAALFSLFVAGCGDSTPAPPPVASAERLALERVAFADLPGWKADRHAEALPAFARSCFRLALLPADTPLGGADAMFGRAVDWREPCAALAQTPDDDEAARRYFETWFEPYAGSHNGRHQGLFTGYYEPELQGARTPGGRFVTPLYRRPPELVTADLGEFNEKLKGERVAGRVVDGRLRPFEDRARIVAGALKGRGLELLWVDSPIEAFFLEIQGSGRIVLPDGAVVRVGFAGQNGHAYTPIGRELIRRNELRREEVSLPAIRAWLTAHPEQAQSLMNINASYVFFREVQGEGPIGSEEAPLTPGRSLAVDRAHVPLGVPVWLDAEGVSASEQRLQRLLIAQDTGGAIRGPIRGDVFWGRGKDAEMKAGRMKSSGRYFLLLPRHQKRGLS